MTDYLIDGKSLIDYLVDRWDACEAEGWKPPRCDNYKVGTKEDLARLSIDQDFNTLDRMNYLAAVRIGADFLYECGCCVMPHGGIVLRRDENEYILAMYTAAPPALFAPRPLFEPVEIVWFPNSYHEYVTIRRHS